MNIWSKTRRYMSKNIDIEGMPLVVKVTAAVSAVSVLSLGTLWFIVSVNLHRLLDEQVDTFGQTIVNQAADSAAELVLADDLLSLNVITQKLTDAPNVLNAVIFDAEYKVLVKSGIFERPVDQAEYYVAEGEGLYTAEIRFQDVIAGYVQVTLNVKAIVDAIQRSLMLMGVATSVILALSIILALRLAQSILKPVRKLIMATDAIRSGDLNFRIREKRRDEMGTLITSFNEMAQGLKEREQLKDTFIRYVPTAVSDNVLSDLESPGIPTSYVHASVLFVDMVGFTSMCERTEPKVVADLLDEYYDYIVKASTFYHGVVDKFLGDGAMIIFGAPQQDAKHSFHAICCARLFLRLAEGINQRREAQGLPIIEFRAGLHSGEMLSGTLGSSERMQYTVVGDTVNVASRLCTKAEPATLIVSEEAYEFADQGRHINVNRKDAQVLRGKSDPVQAYVVEGLATNYEELIDRQVAHLLKVKEASDEA